MFQQNLAPPSTVFEAEATLLRLKHALFEAEYDQKLALFQLALVSGAWEIEDQSRFQDSSKG
jgi:hypothetical protein